MKQVFVTYTVVKDFTVSDATSYEDIKELAEEEAPMDYSDMEIEVEDC